MNQLGIIASTQSNRTSVHTLKCISAWMENGNRIDNPFYVRLKDRQEKGENVYALSDDTVAVLPMTTQKDSDSRMEENLPNLNECRQTEVMNETYVSDAVFSFVGKMPVISDEGRPLFSSSFPTVSAPPQLTAEEESNEDISVDSQI